MLRGGSLAVRRMGAAWRAVLGGSLARRSRDAFSSGARVGAQYAGVYRKAVCARLCTMAQQNMTAVVGDSEAESERHSLEVKDAELIFNRAWEDLVSKYGLENLCFPKEIIWLAGAPGAGKGTVSPFIMQERQIAAEPIVTSSLLQRPELKERMAQGLLVGDREVLQVLLEELLHEDHTNGAIVDGFPRTPVQAQCMKLLYDKMTWLRQHYLRTPYGPKFRRPIFHVAVLFIDEEESVHRQLSRGEETRRHNRFVSEAGHGSEQQVRNTDSDEETARRRYRVFKEHIYDALKVVQQHFHFHFINAMGTVDDVKKNLQRELQYQSSRELGEETFAFISTLPTANDVTAHARQALVKRLDNYAIRYTDLFEEVVRVIHTEFYDIIRRQALSGKALIRSENTVFDNPLALNMALDVLAERGFSVALDVERRSIADILDMNTMKIHHDVVRTFHFEIMFEKPKIRD